jgi:hypothetical protein
MLLGLDRSDKLIHVMKSRCLLAGSFALPSPATAKPGVNGPDRRPSPELAIMAASGNKSI